MPELGEVRSGQDIGYKARGKFTRVACENCGKERWIKKGNEKEERFTGLCVSCAVRRPKKHYRGEEHPWWKGGRKVDDGYVLIKLQPDDFFYPMADTHGYVREHRLVMAKHLNRCLLPWELVHHKGKKYPCGSIENKGDNRLENLELLPHGRFHLVDLQTKARIKQLELQVSSLQAQLKICRER